MTISIKLNVGEVAGIKSYLAEIDSVRNPAQITLEEVRAEVEMRLQNALYDPREAISDHMPKPKGPHGMEALHEKGKIF